MYGFKERDDRLNSCGVVTKECPQETIDLFKGVKHHKGEHCLIKIATTPDGHFLVGVDVGIGTAGMGYAPSLSGTAYDTRNEAIEHGYSSMKYYIEMHPQKARIYENMRVSKNIEDDENPLDYFF